MFGLQRDATRVISGLRYRTECRGDFSELKMFPFPCLYILDRLKHVKTNLNSSSFIHQAHNCHPSNKTNIAFTFQRNNRTIFSLNGYGPRMFNKVPVHVREVPTGIFSNSVRQYLYEKHFIKCLNFIILIVQKDF